MFRMKLISSSRQFDANESRPWTENHTSYQAKNEWHRRDRAQMMQMSYVFTSAPLTPSTTPFTLSFRPQPSRAHRSAYPFSLTIFHFPFFSLFFPSQESSPTITLVSSKVSIVWRDDVHVSLLLHAFPSITHMRTFPLALCAISFWYHILTHSHSQQKKNHILGLNCMIHSKLARKALLNCSSSDIPAERKGYARDFFCRNLVNINAMSCAHIVVH